MRYIDAYNRRDVDAMLATVTEDVIFENVSNASPGIRATGRAELEALARQNVGLFSSRRQTVLQAVVEVDRQAVRIEFEATVAEDLPNGWKQGQLIRLQGVSFFELRDGRIGRIVDFS